MEPSDPEAAPQLPQHPTPKLVETGPSEPGFVSRDAWLAHPINLLEEHLHVPGLGKVIVSEVSAFVRAEVVTLQSAGLLKETGKSIDRVEYETKLLVAGLVDPQSPEGARVPLFRKEDIPRVMRMGSSKLEPIVDAIERLSHLGRYSTSAEGNSAATPNDAGSSG